MICVLPIAYRTCVTPVCCIVSHENIVTSPDPKRRSINIVKYVVNQLDITAFIMKPWRDHVLQACALASTKPCRATVVNSVAVHDQMRAAPLKNIAR